MHVVAFGSEPLDSFYYRDLLETIPTEFRYFVGAEEPDRATSGVRILSMEEARELSPEHTLALVAEPLWVSAFRGWRPKWLVTLVSGTPSATPVQRRWADLVTGMADAVLVESESLYLHLCFRRSGVFFWDPHRPREEGRRLTVQVIQALVDRDDLERMEIDQWRSRLAEYEALANQEEIAETVLYLTASYRYLLGDSAAPHDLLASFERAVAAGRADCLTTHYRFLSAMLAKQGRLEEAVQVYGVTAVDERDKEEYARLMRWIENGWRELARARLFLLNDDVRSARNILNQFDESMDGESTRRLRIEADVRAGRLEEAYRRLIPDDRKSRAARRDIAVQEGLLHWMKGERAEAIHRFLQAAAEDPRALEYVLDVGEAEEILKRIRYGGGRDDATRAQTGEQSRNGHDAGAQ